MKLEILNAPVTCDDLEVLFSKYAVKPKYIVPMKCPNFIVLMEYTRDAYYLINKITSIHQARGFKDIKNFSEDEKYLFSLYNIRHTNEEATILVLAFYDNDINYFIRHNKFNPNRVIPNKELNNYLKQIYPEYYIGE